MASQDAVLESVIFLCLWWRCPIRRLERRASLYFLSVDVDALKNNTWYTPSIKYTQQSSRN